MLSLETPLATGILKEGIADGIPALAGRLAVYGKALRDEEAMEVVRGALPGKTTDHAAPTRRVPGNRERVRFRGQAQSLAGR